MESNKVSLKNSFNNLLITEVPELSQESNNRKLTAMSAHTNIRKQTLKTNINNRINKDETKSFFKVKANFDDNKQEILDYFLKNQTEYLDLEKYETHYKDLLVAKNKQFSINKVEYDKKNSRLEELNNTINTMSMNQFNFSTKEIEKAYEDVISNMKNKM